MKRLFALVLALSLLLCGCTKKAEQTHFAMNTVMTFTVWANPRDTDYALATCRGIVNGYEEDWSVTREESVISRLNRGEAVELGDVEQFLLDSVQALSERTGGVFNPKMRRLSEAWGFYNEQHRVPAQEEIDAAMADPQWDLGGALKGFAGFQIAYNLERQGVHRALLNLGGNVQTVGEKADGTPWQVGIQNPDGGDYVGIVSVTGTMAVVTSGDYQRYFEKDGIRYHHILDPETGYPADSGLRSVTVICADGMTADCLSTALFVMGLEKGSDFWRASDDFEAVFITTGGTIHATEGANLSGCEHEVITR